MTNRFTRELSYGKKALLALAAVLVIGAPILVGLMGPSRGRAQSQAGGGSLPSFEAASIKPTALSDRPISRFSGGPGTNSPGQLTSTNNSLRSLIARAYNKMKPWELVALSPLPTDKYDIFAKVPAGATGEQFNLMVQNLLVERFGLVIHREMREMAVSELVVTKGGSKLRESEKPPAGAQPAHSTRDLPKDKDGWPILPPGFPGLFQSRVGANERISFRMQPVSELTVYLVRYAVRPVVDKTGLTGTYDFDVTYPIPDGSPMRAAAGAESQTDLGGVVAARDPGLSFIDAVEQQLGLKLVRSKGPVEVLVVDHVNKTPTEN